MRRSTSLSLGVVTSLALAMLLASVAYAAPIKKLYTANITPAASPVTAGQPETFNVVIANKTATQSLGSCNLTLPSSVTGISATNPLVGTATVVGNVIQLRNLAMPPMGSRSFTFTATSPNPSPPAYVATIDCRQANNYSPSTPSNAFTLDAANSSLSWSAVSPTPNADLSVVTQSRTPAGSVAGGNTVSHILVVTNNGPASSGTPVTFSDSVSGAGSITYIAAMSTGWTCSATSTSGSCQTGNALANGATATFEVRVEAPQVSSNSSFTNTASVSQGAQSNDPVPSNNSSPTTTTVTTGSSNSSGFISNADGGNVTSEEFATAVNRFVVSITFPGQEGATSGGFVYTMNQDTDTCALMPCTFAERIDDIPAAYDNPETEGVRLVIKCDATVCNGSGTAITMFVRDETGSQKVVIGCSFLGFVDPNPCVEKTERLSGGEDEGDLAITMLFLAGDPRVAGLCFGSC